MPLTSDGLAEHPLWESIETAQQRTIAALPNTDGKEAELIATWQSVLDFTARLKEIEPWRFAQNGVVLNSLKDQLDALAAELQQLIDDPQLSITTTLQSRLDAYATHLAPAPTMAMTSGHLSGVTGTVARFEEAVGEAIRSMRSSSEKELSSLEEKVSDATEKLTETTTKLAQQQQRTDAAVTNQTETFDARMTAWSSAADDQVGHMFVELTAKGATQDSAAKI